MHATLPLLETTDFPEIKRDKLETLQVNLGYLCNQSCLHCHVNAGPNRKEQMDLETINHIINFLKTHNIKRLDLTGGAPELNPHFRYLVESARSQNIHVIDRCNLTILQEPEEEGLAEFLANNQVEVVASMPCYLQENVDNQRGKGTYNKSIDALKKLNNLGYGSANSGLELNLMYNPSGPHLPPGQEALQQDYKRELKNKYNIIFNNLYTLTNMPILRFGSMLVSKGEFNNYMATLKDAYLESNLQTVMCRSLISIDWQGYVYDCDFNQMLELPLKTRMKHQAHIKDLNVNDLSNNNIVIADHCYGCTAGQGSSCNGSLS